MHPWLQASSTSQGRLWRQTNIPKSLHSRSHRPLCSRCYLISFQLRSAFLSRFRNWFSKVHLHFHLKKKHFAPITLNSWPVWIKRNQQVKCIRPNTRTHTDRLRYSDYSTVIGKVWNNSSLSLHHKRHQSVRQWDSSTGNAGRFLPNERPTFTTHSIPQHTPKY